MERELSLVSDNDTGPALVKFAEALSTRGSNLKEYSFGLVKALRAPIEAGWSAEIRRQ